jgi:chromosome segregation protein
MNYFVIENVDEASKAVNLLSEASKGRANFFILKNFGDETAVHSLEVPDCIPALEIIEVEEKYIPLCNHLLRNVFVVTENQDSTPYIQNGNQSLVFISQNGKFCKTRHALSGGSVGLFDGKRIGRGKQLEALSKEINELTVAVRKIKTTRDTLQEELQDAKQRREKFTSEKNVLQQESNKAAQEYSSLRNKAEHIFSTIENNKKISANLRQQLLSVDGSLEESNANYEEHLQTLKTQFETITAQLTAMQLEFNSTVDLLNKQSAGFNEHNILCIQQQNKIATVVRDLAHKVTLLENLTRNISANTTEFENVQQQINELVKTSADFDTQLVTLYGEKEIMEQSVSVVEAAYFTARGTIDELENKLRTLRFEKEQANQLMNAIKEKTNELKLQLNSLQERLSVEFNIVLSEILDREPSPDWTEELLREKVNKIKLQIENYGPINPMAVEAFNEINERYTFINVQKEDLAKAKESLLLTMSEIEITARENFMTAFTKIRENFINVFRSLFTDDDKCDLILMNPENPTESDIQIVAQPKGKRPLSIQQLSGGEKTLTATALLFSIYLLKPAPFCIFDEVDAPLDDNNIDKFNNIIKKFSVDSQFIIITHNKRTMTATNIIYGITMVEQGVTQLVPVDLGEMAEA